MIFFNKEEDDFFVIISTRNYFNKEEDDVFCSFKPIKKLKNIQ
jgi:hypothetical protein